MVSLDINLSGTLNSTITTVEENNSGFANESNMEAVEQNESETEADDANAYEESEAEADRANADEISKNATFGHNFEIDISRIYPRKQNRLPRFKKYV